MLYNMSAEWRPSRKGNFVETNVLGGQGGSQMVNVQAIADTFESEVFDWSIVSFSYLGRSRCGASRTPEHVRQEIC